MPLNANKFTEGCQRKSREKNSTQALTPSTKWNKNLPIKCKSLMKRTNKFKKIEVLASCIKAEMGR